MATCSEAPRAVSIPSILSLLRPYKFWLQYFLLPHELIILLSIPTSGCYPLPKTAATQLLALGR